MDCLDLNLIDEKESTFNLTSAGITESEMNLVSYTSEGEEMNGIFSEGRVLREYKVDKHRRFASSIDFH